MKKVELVDLITLGFLSIKPMYGYEINGILKKMQWDNLSGISKATVYNSFKRNEPKGYLDSETVTTEGRPPKTLYFINKDGLDYLRKLVKYSLELFTAETPFVFNIGFQISFLLKQSTVRESLKSRVSSIEKTMGHIKAHTLIDKKYGSKFFKVTMDSVKMHLKIELNKTKELINLIEEDKDYGKKQLKMLKTIELSKLLLQGDKR